MCESPESPDTARGLSSAPARRPHDTLSPAEQAAEVLAHELRGPLSVVLGYLGILERAEDEQTRDHALAAAKRAAKRMDSLIDEVLSSLDPTAHPDALLPERISARECVVKAVAELPPCHVPVKVLPGDDGFLVARELSISRILANVIGNAVKFSPRDGVVTVSIERRLGRVLVAVEDEGPGIPPDARDDVFEPFARLPRDSTVPGFGLGLSICRSLAAEIGGAVNVDAPRGAGGTRVLIDLPSAPETH